MHLGMKSQDLDVQLCKKKKSQEMPDADVCERNGASDMIFPKQMEISDSSPAQTLTSSKQRTVGKVSSVIGAKAEKLSYLYENDHKRKTAWSFLSPGSLRKAYPQVLGGGDTCHFCGKQVYLMERGSAEGRCFHRDCFRCQACGAPLRLGGHTYHTDHGQFYCKECAQLNVSTRPWGSTCQLQMDGSVAGTLEGFRRSHPARPRRQSAPAGILLSFLRETLCWPLSAPRCLACWLQSAVRVTGRHLWVNAEDYTFLYELLSLGFPLLCAMQDVLTQMSSEPSPLSD